MTHAALVDALDGFFAWDEGAVDSGIHDAALKVRVYAEIRALSQRNRLRVLAEFLDRYLSDPYTPEDAEGAAQWLREQGLVGAASQPAARPDAGGEVQHAV